MNERDFLIELRQRVNEQHHLMHNMPFPHVFTLIAEWLGNHPWRLLIPLAFLLTLLFYGLLGHRYVDFILKIFGKI